MGIFFAIQFVGLVEGGQFSNDVGVESGESISFEMEKFQAWGVPESLGFNGFEFAVSDVQPAQVGEVGEGLGSWREKVLTT